MELMLQELTTCSGARPSILINFCIIHFLYSSFHFAVNHINSVNILYSFWVIEPFDNKHYLVSSYSLSLYICRNLILAEILSDSLSPPPYNSFISTAVSCSKCMINVLTGINTVLEISILQFQNFLFRICFQSCKLISLCLPFLPLRYVHLFNLFWKKGTPFNLTTIVLLFYLFYSQSFRNYSQQNDNN